MLKFGFEVEGFLRKVNDQFEDGPVVMKLPDAGKYPVDGFPALIEARTVGGADINVAISSLWREVRRIAEIVTKNDPDYIFDTWQEEYKFTPKEKLKLREGGMNKTPCKIRNVYGKSPKDLKGTTIASFQINISNVLREAFTIDGGPNKTTHVSENYGLLDITTIVKNLDNLFEKEIKDSGRTPGWYAIKGGYRLEYRSLPNFVANSLIDRYDTENVKERILEATKGTY